MLDNLKIAIKRQNRIILIFFLTIFVPSVLLGIFGIRAIRNERFRVAKQLENEHRRAAEYLKSQVKNGFNELRSNLQSLANSASFSDMDYLEIKKLLVTQLENNPLMKYVFLAHEDEEPFFPQFQPGSRDTISSISQLKRSHIDRLKQAEAYEFQQKKHDRAISIYRELFDQSEDNNVKAQMLFSIARSQMKGKDYKTAIENFRRIIKDYADSVSASNMPLAIISGLQVVSSYRALGDFQNAIKTALILYWNILDKTWDLTETQFRTYYSLADEAVAGIVSDLQNEGPGKEFSQELDQIRVLFRERIEQWRAKRDIEQEIIPELKRRIANSPGSRSYPHLFSKTIDGNSYFIAVVLYPDQADVDFSGFLGALADHEYLTDDVLRKLIKNMQFSEDTNIVVSNLAGNPLLGEKDPSIDLISIAEFFDDNFPPWKIEFFRKETSGLGGIDIKKNFYFWTIVVLLIVLIFGAVLIMRTISHEMELLKIKSDFVSSVSHEFKTPLTSTRTLIERLQAGKVLDDAKMKQYFSIIAQDTDKLTLLVGNVLDFSKIEEGKREYEFERTDVGKLVAQQIQEFRKNELWKEVYIQVIIQEDIPNISVDSEALSQALNILLDNAAKFSSDKKEISVHVGQDEGNLVIHVEDKGIGIPPDEMDKIFDKFYQGKNALKQTVKGTGLGLTLVKHMVDAHGGRVSVKSKIGEGSRFSLIFPVEKKSK